MTPTQRNSLHKYLRNLADALNAAGLDMKKTLKPQAEIPWTMETAKDHLWRPIQEAMGKPESTEDLGTVDPSEVYNVLQRHIAAKFGINVEWPDRFNGGGA